MLRLLADENLNASIVRGLLRRVPSADVISVQAVGLSGASDAEVLEWAANAGRVLVTHDVNTIPRFVRERLAARLPMPGVIEISAGAPLGAAIGDLVLIVECSLDGEWEGQILHLPLRGG